MGGGEGGGRGGLPLGREQVRGECVWGEGGGLYSGQAVYKLRALAYPSLPLFQSDY